MQITFSNLKISNLKKETITQGLQIEIAIEQIFQAIFFYIL